MKKLISLILIASMIAAAFTVTAAAVTDSGVCGDSLAWTYNATTKVLTVSGSGEMYDFTAKDVPWKDYRAATLAVIIEPGAESIGDYAFHFFSSTTEVLIPNSVQSIGASAFNYAMSLASVRFAGTSDEWQSVVIDSGNSYLTGAQMEYVTVCEAYGHSIDASSYAAPTCTEAGYEDGVCSVCGEEIYTVIPPLGHYFTNVTPVDGTHYTRICSHCGETESLACGAGSCFSVFGGTAGAGETFEVPVFLTGNPGIWAAKVYVYFRSGFDVISIENGNVFPNGELTASPAVIDAEFDDRASRAFSGCGVDPAGYKCVCAYYQRSDFYTNNTSNGLLFTLTMKAPDTGGEYFLGVLDSPTDVCDCNMDEVPFSFVDSSVTVIEGESHVHEWDEGVVTVPPTSSSDGIRTYTCSVCGRTKDVTIPAFFLGDVDGNGKVNGRDLIVLKKLIAGSLQPGDVPNYSAGDTNGDGKVNGKDITPLKKIIAGQTV